MKLPCTASWVTLRDRVLRTFDPARRAVLTTDASNVNAAAILTQPDEEGRQHQVEYKSHKLTAAEWNCQAHVLELLAVVHALRAFRDYLLGGGAAGRSRAPQGLHNFEQVLLQRRRVHQAVVHVHQHAPAPRS